MTDPIFDLVIADLRAREAQGAETYGKARMEAHDGRDSLVDLYEELLDAVAYAKKEIVERDIDMARLRVEEWDQRTIGRFEPESDEDYARRMGWYRAVSTGTMWGREDAGYGTISRLKRRWLLRAGTGRTKHASLRAAVDAYAAQEVGS